MKTLDDIQPGDEVVVKNLDSRWIEKVSRVSKTRIFIRVNDRYEEPYQKNTGYRVGRRSWDYTKISPITDELREDVRREVRKKNLCNYLRQESWGNYSLETLAEVYAILKKAKESKEVVQP